MGLMSTDTVIDYADKMHPFVTPGNEPPTGGNYNLETVKLKPPEENGEHWIPLSRQVIFHCPNKNITVSGVINSPLKLDANSNWVEIFGNDNGIMGGAFNLMESINGMDTMLTGKAIRQPWMSRKNWKATNPLHFQVETMFKCPSFLEAENVEAAAQYPFVQLCQLLALVYPRRENPGSDSGNKSLPSTKGMSKTEYAYETWGGFANTWKTVADVVKQFVTGIAGDQYIIPGPAITVNNDGSNKGDPVVVILGNYGVFRQCYIEKVSVEASKNLNILGYPHWVKATVDFSKADMSWVEGDKLVLDADQDGNEMEALATTFANLIGNYMDGLAVAFGNLGKSMTGSGARDIRN